MWMRPRMVRACSLVPLRLLVLLGCVFVCVVSLRPMPRRFVFCIVLRRVLSLVLRIVRCMVLRSGLRIMFRTGMPLPRRTALSLCFSIGKQWSRQ